MLNKNCKLISAEMLAAIPNLRAFAISLCKDRVKADDLVQEALMRALSNIESYKPGTNMKTWLLTILRNAYFTDRRKLKREIEDVNQEYALRLCIHPPQHGALRYSDFCKALDQLHDDQREALLLVAAEGLSYEDAAIICGCAVGTIKSRVNRARLKLAELLESETIDFVPDSMTTAVIQNTKAN